MYKNLLKFYTMLNIKIRFIKKHRQFQYMNNKSYLLSEFTCSFCASADMFRKILEFIRVPSLYYGSGCC